MNARFLVGCLNVYVPVSPDTRKGSKVHNHSSKNKQDMVVCFVAVFRNINIEGESGKKLKVNMVPGYQNYNFDN